MVFLFNSDKKSRKDSTFLRLERAIGELNGITSRLADIEERIETVERVLAERLPPDILTERRFKEEVESGDEIIERIISKVEELSAAKSIRDLLEERLEEKPTPVEMKRIESITELLHQHGKMSSKELSKHIGLSRTRCNEYFKQMESMGLVEPFSAGKEKFYRLG